MCGFSRLQEVIKNQNWMDGRRQAISFLEDQSRFGHEK